MSTATTTIQATLLLRSPATTIWQHPANNAVHMFAFKHRASFGGRCFASSKSPNSNSNDADTSQDNLKFLLKLGAGSFAGAAVIKYGSILVPEITRPNITLALIMIITPVIVSVLILIKESTVEQ